MKTSVSLTIVVVFTAALVAQNEKLPTSEPSARSPGNELVYPRDQDCVLARVDGDDLTLGDLVRHMTERHTPDLERYLATEVGAHFFRTPLAADWVRHFADVTALRAAARARKADPRQVDAALSASLKAAFATHLEGIRAERERTGRTTELSQRTVDIYLDEFQRFRGLQTEVQGWLDFLVPDHFTEQELYEFFNGHAFVFGGRVTFAHILIQNRDAVTLALLGGEDRKRALAKLEDVRARLQPDGSNFEEVARAHSEDRKTAARGGVFEDVERFDPGLPAILCRTAWRLRDGEWTGPVESHYGLHLVKRIRLSRVTLLLYTDQTKPLVRDTLRKFRQENLIFDARKHHRVELSY